MTETLDKVMFEGRVPGVLDFNPQNLLKYLSVAHDDGRRTIYNFNELPENIPKEDYNPEALLKGFSFGQTWFPHGLILLKNEVDAKTGKVLRLGKHNHDYNELFLAPRGSDIQFTLLDLESLGSRTYYVLEGSRLLVPKGVGHAAIGKKGSFLMSYGDVPYDGKRAFPLFTKEAISASS